MEETDEIAGVLAAFSAALNNQLLRILRVNIS